MKNSLLTVKLIFILSLVFSHESDAQITDGNWLIGGTGYFASNYSKRETSGSPNEVKGVMTVISPNIGYFLIDKLALGTGLSLSFSSPSGENNNSWGYSVGPFLRYYFLKPEKTLNFLTEVNYYFGQTWSDYTNDPRRSSTYGIKGGPVIFFRNNAALELTLNYFHSTSKREEENNTINKQFLISIGFQIHLK